MKICTDSFNNQHKSNSAHDRQMPLNDVLLNNSYKYMSIVPNYIYLN